MMELESASPGSSREIGGCEIPPPFLKAARRHSFQGFPTRPVGRLCLAFSASDNSNLPWIWALKMRFSALVRRRHTSIVLPISGIRPRVRLLFRPKSFIPPCGAKKLD
jgi:hypothetical protein